MHYKVAAFYRFLPIEDVAQMRARILDFARQTPSVCGTILLAPEGVNSTIAAHASDLDAMIEFLDGALGIRQGVLKFAAATEKPFLRFKVRPKKEIITLRRPEADPARIVGQYVTPQAWNDLLADPEVVLLDTRNDYETKLGIFEGAIDPRIKTFSEFPQWVEKNLDPARHKKIAMFCTGGIRCEKASAYMLSQGFTEVYHLKGGILQYLEDVPEQDSRWRGSCFVFDKRVGVDHGLREGDWGVCHGCREPLSPQEMQDPAYEPGVSCPHCRPELAPARAQALRARHRQMISGT